MGLLFQPGPRAHDEVLRHAPGIDEETLSTGRGQVLLVAIGALLLGRVEQFSSVMTEDVVVTAPHVLVVSLEATQRLLGLPEVSLTDPCVLLERLYSGDDWLVGEWSLTARHTGPVLYDDDILVEPTGRVTRLTGVSVAEFCGRRIRSIRSYFDDRELLGHVPYRSGRAW
jgi:hypothetical protein